MQDSGVNGISKFQIWIQNFKKDFKVSWKLYELLITKMI